MVALVALAAVFVPRSLPYSAARAEKLYKQRDARQGQTQQHTQTAPRERAVSGAHIQFVVLMSMCTLTLAELDICVRRRKGASHPCATATQRQRGSADGAHRRLRQARTHALACTHPWQCSRAHATRWNVSAQPRNDWQNRPELDLGNHQHNNSQRCIISSVF